MLSRKAARRRLAEWAARGGKMAASDLRDIFNSIVNPLFTCERAHLHYVPRSGVEMQVLEFHVMGANGAAEVVKTDPMRAETDLAAATREFAAAYLERKGKP
jgi:hypothetical protein